MCMLFTYVFLLIGYKNETYHLMEFNTFVHGVHTYEYITSDLHLNCPLVKMENIYVLQLNFISHYDYPLFQINQ
jgi:hypothetical protein